MSNYREPDMNVRVYLSVPYSDIAEAKELGCKWDTTRKKWYSIDSDYGKSNVTQCVSIWHTPAPYKIINEIYIPLSDIPDRDRGYTQL